MKRITHIARWQSHPYISTVYIERGETYHVYEIDTTSDVRLWRVLRRILDYSNMKYGWLWSVDTFDTATCYLDRVYANELPLAPRTELVLPGTLALDPLPF